MSVGPALGRLAVVPPREVWPHEAHDFTPWLLSNVDVLSDLLSMDLVLDAAEHAVGDFRLDLIGKDLETNGIVIVENQLEASNHDHLGQILTYAAGTDPTTIIWITTGFRPEHRAAIDWLNERTDDETRFFGVVIEVVRIGNSTPAPAFRLVAQPNDWEKQIRKSSGTSGAVTAKEELLRRFWEEVLDRIRTEYPQWTRARTTNQSFCNTTSGTAGVYLAMVWRRDALTMQIYFEASPSDPDLNRARFERLHARHVEFEQTLGTTPEWDEMRGRKAARVIVASDFVDLAAEGDWPEMTEWLIEQQVRFRSALNAVGGTA